MIYKQNIDEEQLFLDEDDRPITVKVDYDFTKTKDAEHKMGEFFPETGGEIKKIDIEEDEIIDTKNLKNGKQKQGNRKLF